MSQRSPPLYGFISTERQVDFLHQIVFDFWSEVDESDEIFADFGGRDGFSDANGGLEFFERGDCGLGVEDGLLRGLHIQ